MNIINLIVDIRIVTTFGYSFVNKNHLYLHVVQHIF